eukprot:3996302-Pyramimonas_sp.AAC.1
MAHAGDVTHLDMQKAWRAQYRVIAAAHRADIWRLVTGPAGAFARSPHALALACSSAFAVRARSWELLDRRGGLRFCAGLPGGISRSWDG